MIGALYPLPFGRKLVGGYVIAVAAVVALPGALGAAVCARGGADGGRPQRRRRGGAFGNFIAQFWVLGASLATFALAVKLGFSAFGFASSTITSFTAGALLGGAAGGRGQLAERHADGPQGAQPLQRRQRRSVAHRRRRRIAGSGGRPHRGRAANPRARRGAARRGRLGRAATGPRRQPGRRRRPAAQARAPRPPAPPRRARRRAAAAQTGSKAAAERAAVSGAQPGQPSGPTPSPQSVRSTASGDDRERRRLQRRLPAASRLPPSRAIGAPDREAQGGPRRSRRPPSSARRGRRGERDGGKGR